MKKKFLWSACILGAIFLAATLIGPSIILHAVRFTPVCPVSHVHWTDHWPEKIPPGTED